MAQTPKVITIDPFKGVNMKTTETLLELGEASYMSNFFITDDLKLEKMFGYARLFESLGNHKINGMWHGSLSGTDHFLFACNGHVYEHNLETHANTDIGTITDAYPTTFWVTNNTVYILDGTELYSWSGTGSISAVVGYVPTILTASPPSGGGTLLESINYLSGSKIQKFSADGTHDTFQLAEYNIDSVDSVYYNGILQTVGVDYSVNLTAGKVTFLAGAPADGENNVVIRWTKVTPGDRQLITNCRYYGGVYYARFWLYGNSNHKNTRYVSGVTMAGVSDPTYWPKYADSDVGEYEITGICTQYNKQIIFTKGNGSEASAWYSYADTYTDESTKLLVTIFPVFPMNAIIGNVAPGQVQIIYNNPVSVWKGVYEWVATNVVDEKNATWISDRVQRDLDTVDLSKAITIDWADKGQYWLCVGKRVWVLNYRVWWYDSSGNRVRGAWFVLDIKHSPTCFATVNSKLCFGTADGMIMEFDENALTYDGENINAVWKMPFYHFGTDWLRKSIKRMFVSIKPYVKTHIDIAYETDVDGASDTYTASYALAVFDDMDFSNFSFETNYNPQPFKFKIRAKKFDYFRLVLTNDGSDRATVLAITMKLIPNTEVRGR